MVRLDSEVVVGVIRRIRYENDQIYLTDGQTLFIYSNSGKYISHFKRTGAGPHEYRSISDFIVDGDTITIISRNSRKILKYDHSGYCLSENNHEYYETAISPTVGDFNFVFSGNSNEFKLRKLQNGLTASFELPVDENQANYLHNTWHHHFFRNNQIIYFFELFNDTIYSSFGRNDITPSFYVDFHGKNVPAAFFKSKFSNVAEFRQEFDKMSYAYGVFNFVINDQILMLFSNYQEDIKLTLFNRKDGISQTFSEINYDICFNGLTIPANIFTNLFVEKNLFIPIDAYQIIEWRNAHSPTEQFKDIINAVDEDDNPVLFIFDFKR
jgi:hypothetical protein